MNKLIDVNHFLEQFSDHIPGDKIDAIDLRLALLNEPTVEAIPIEWLHKHSCYNVVDLWRKDCQLQDAKDVVCSILKEYNFNSYDEFIRYAWKMRAAAKLVPPEKLNEIIIKKDEEENENSK